MLIGIILALIVVIFFRISYYHAIKSREMYKDVILNILRKNWQQPVSFRYLVKQINIDPDYINFRLSELLHEKKVILWDEGYTVYHNPAARPK